MLCKPSAAALSRHPWTNCFICSTGRSMMAGSLPPSSSAKNRNPPKRIRTESMRKMLACPSLKRMTFPSRLSLKCFCPLPFFWVFVNTFLNAVLVPLPMAESFIWTEKYRPEKFSDIRGQKEIVKRVKALVDGKNMPHLLFTGPAGGGKTTMSLVIARQLFGQEWHRNFLELNASDERGIDVVRNKVKDFARTRAIGDVPFKIIYLDECDALTREAQQALRRTMENYTQTCRFILSANYSSKIIDPIQSRCAIFRFKRLDKKEIFEIIDNIAKEEKLKIDDKAKEALYEVSEGDCRKLENILQSAGAIESHITEDLVHSMASIAKPKEIKEVLELAIRNKFVEARNKLLDLMLTYGLAGSDVIKQIQKEIIDLDTDNKSKMILIEKCGEIEFRMTEGSDEFIQLEALLSQFALVGNKRSEERR